MDYIIIQKDGGILHYAESELPSGRKDFPVYGDLDEARTDFNSKEDLLIVGLDYSRTGNKETVTIRRDDKERYDFGKEVGQFSCKIGDEEGFREALLDYVTLYDFVSHQLPH